MIRKSKEKNPVLVRFGEKIRQLRKGKKWAQEDVTEKSGLHRTYIAGVERGERNLTLRNIQKLAAAFGISLRKLFQEQ